MLRRCAAFTLLRLNVDLVGICALSRTKFGDVMEEASNGHQDRMECTTWTSYIWNTYMEGVEIAGKTYIKLQ